VGKVTVSEFVTLDGVMQDPGGGGEFEKGGWQVPFFDHDLNSLAREILLDSDALLLGRITFELYAQAWPTITDEDGFADKMNSMPKFVASTTLAEPLEWNGTLLKGDVIDEVRRLKKDHNLLINGSGQLVQALMKHGLIDDFRIWIHPVVLGAGKRLFIEGSETAAMTLKNMWTTSTGVVVLALEATD
jgi:dihydrofolate reductase